VKLLLEAADPAELGGTGDAGALLVVPERDLDGIVGRAAELAERPAGLVFGLPATEAGLRAVRALAAGRHRTAVLGCPTPEAALAGARAGGGYLAPARAASGKVAGDLVRKLASLLRTFDYKALVLVSAIRNLDDLADAALAGAQAAGVSRDVAAQAARVR
jgi:transaldolase